MLRFGLEPQFGELLLKRIAGLAARFQLSPNLLPPRVFDLEAAAPQLREFGFDALKHLRQFIYLGRQPRVRLCSWARRLIGAAAAPEDCGGVSIVLRQHEAPQVGDLCAVSVHHRVEFAVAALQLAFGSKRRVQASASSEGRVRQAAVITVGGNPPALRRRI